MTEFSHPPLSPIKDQLERLIVHGEQFPQLQREFAWRELPDCQIPDGAGGLEPALYDSRIIPLIPHMVVPDHDISRALRRVRHGELTTPRLHLLDAMVASEGLIVGFSGYGTAGFGYQTEHDGINTVLDAFAPRQWVSHVVDGGTGFGVPGLAGAIAQKRREFHGEPFPETVGFLPLRSLRGIAPRDASVIVGEQFGDETEVLGAAPDVLFVFGGGPLAERELRLALSVGSTVVLAALKDYHPTSAAHVLDRAAENPLPDTGNVIKCDTADALQNTIANFISDELMANRTERLTEIKANLP